MAILQKATAELSARYHVCFTVMLQRWRCAKAGMAHLGMGADGRVCGGFGFAQLRDLNQFEPSCTCMLSAVSIYSGTHTEDRTAAIQQIAALAASPPTESSPLLE